MGKRQGRVSARGDAAQNPADGTLRGRAYHGDADTAPDHPAGKGGDSLYEGAGLSADRQQGLLSGCDKGKDPEAYGIEKAGGKAVLLQNQPAADLY